ncbi:MAG TPA: GlsB/YeaQ/YmgE family stress response membrane protein [Bellilinea sp.]|nr:GlsB/YeaQ/YmgE family stress response membrane protein [Bellilinea sp.]
MNFLVWILVGAIAGLLADYVVSGVKLGLLMAIIVGLIGGLVGGWVFSLLNIGGGGIIWDIIASFVGAVIVLVIVRALKK